MECKNTFISPRQRAAFTLVELLVATALSVIVATAVALLAFYTSRSFVAMNHYTDMNQLSRLALDKMSAEIRQARQLTAYATNSVTFQDLNGNPLRFTFDPAAKTLVRVSGGVTTTYLTDCEALQFWIYQHTVKSNTFNCYDPAYVTNARVLQVTWRCSRQILSLKTTTDSAESAQIVLRNH